MLAVESEKLRALPAISGMIRFNAIVLVRPAVAAAVNTLTAAVICGNVVACHGQISWARSGHA